MGKHGSGYLYQKVKGKVAGVCVGHLMENATMKALEPKTLNKPEKLRVKKPHVLKPLAMYAH